MERIPFKDLPLQQQYDEYRTAARSTFRRLHARLADERRTNVRVTEAMNTTRSVYNRTVSAVSMQLEQVKQGNYVLYQ